MRQSLPHTTFSCLKRLPHKIFSFTSFTIYRWLKKYFTWWVWPSSKWVWSYIDKKISLRKRILKNCKSFWSLELILSYYSRIFLPVQHPPESGNYKSHLLHVDTYLLYSDQGSLHPKSIYVDIRIIWLLICIKAFRK